MYAIIMAGGAGTRFWPLSRAGMPKQFLAIVGNRPLIQETYLRIAPIVKEENIYIVVNEAHKALVKRIFRNKNVKIVTEPYSRNTAPCIGLAAIHIGMKSDVAPAIALPADHFIIHSGHFQKVLRAAAKVVQKKGIAAIGIKPSYPETGYGYIKKSTGHGFANRKKVYRVDKFVEKPPFKDAQLYVQSGQYLWNSGIFVFKPNTILEEIRLHLPHLYDSLERIKVAIGSRSYSRILRKVYQDIESISIDHGIMEKTKNPMYVLEGTFGWSDVGSWKAIRDINKDGHDAKGNLIHGESLSVDTKDSLIYSSTKRLIATLGLKDTVIVDTEDAVLVADMKKSQEVRKIIESLKETNKKKWL
jgi:mannose-1-phosphate guanylyltransferase